MSDFKRGDRVQVTALGAPRHEEFGTVYQIRSGTIYPVVVQFKSRTGPASCMFVDAELMLVERQRWFRWLRQGVR